ncbi:hypothetical protein PVNG_06033 [Plasmodium vivax North Korean]|uniref:VIR protein n=1 Tax=Plasmodium vivax North Korean TaxID=1035514 RepID=A0A0J9TN05_PLAVI|nr:hypothetical protein PVNG_06033 [Plasmodium vivax North Korean]
MHHGVFYEADRRIPCSYINYLLNKTVRELDKHLPNPNYEILKDFVREVHSSMRYGDHDTNLCTSKIKSLDYEEYTKMTRLYELYDLYSVFDRYHNKSNFVVPPSECDTLGELTRKHDKIIKDYEDEDFPNNVDNDLIDKRMKIKDLIKNLKLKFIEFCYYNYRLELGTSKFEEKRKEELERQELERQRLAREKLEKEKLEKQELENQLALKRLEQEKEQASLLLSGNTYLDTRVNEVNPQKEVSKDKPTYHIEKPHQVDTAGNGELPVIGHSSYSQGRGLLDNSLLNQREDNSYPLRFPDDSQLNGEKAINEEGIIGTMKNAITGVLGEVDPVPVVGVSGGMGALFLLFRYTPVRAFFRGGRGRIHRIPRSFNGPFPGGFPGYEEYDGGYIGYGPMNMNPLAE